MHGLLAQLGERMGHNHDVAGSSPSQTTIKALKPMASALFVLFRLILYYFAPLYLNASIVMSSN